MVTIEQIDEFRKRTNSSYEDARFFLERNNGDVLEAIIDFEKVKASWNPHTPKMNKGEFGRKFAELLQKGFDLRMTVEDKSGKMLFTVPILLLLILTPVWPMMMLACAFLILLGYHLGFRDIKSTAVNMTEIFTSIGNQMREARKPQESKPGRSGQPVQPQHGRPVQPGQPMQPNRPVQPMQPMHPDRAWQPGAQNPIPVTADNRVATGAGMQGQGRPAERLVMTYPASAPVPAPEDDDFIEFTVE